MSESIPTLDEIARGAAAAKDLAIAGGLVVVVGGVTYVVLKLSGVLDGDGDVAPSQITLGFNSLLPGAGDFLAGFGIK